MLTSQSHSVDSFLTMCSLLTMYSFLTLTACVLTSASTLPAPHTLQACRTRCPGSLMKNTQHVISSLNLIHFTYACRHLYILVNYMVGPILHEKLHTQMWPPPPPTHIHMNTHTKKTEYDQNPLLNTHAHQSPVCAS